MAMVATKSLISDDCLSNSQRLIKVGESQSLMYGWVIHRMYTHQDVLGLEIAVDHITRVDELERHYDFSHVKPGLFC